MAWTWDGLGAATLARQFPTDPPPDPAGLLELVGPIQSQTARSPFLGLAARLPGVTRAAISAAYEAGTIVRGSTIRGTVHTATPDQYGALGAATRLGQRGLWQRALNLERSTLEDLWSDTETFATGWRSTDELQDHLRHWLVTREGRDETSRSQDGGRYLAFGHGGLVRRPVNGDWAGQGAPAYRTLPPRTPVTVSDAVLLHLRCHGPASRHDLAWWSGLGLRVVDELVGRLDLVEAAGPDGRTYVDLPDAPAPRDLPGVRLLPEFDAVLCGYDPRARERFVDPAHQARLWNAANGLVRPSLLVDGRVTGHWRAAGSARRRPLEVVWFSRTRRPRRAELEAPVAALEAALDVTVTDLTVTREQV